MASELWRKATAGLAAFASAVALAGCGSADGGSSTEGGKTTLTWNMWTGSTAEVKTWKHVADMVSEKYPDIRLEFQTSSFEDYWTKLVAQASSGDVACILGVQSLRAPGIEQVLTPLDGMLADSGVDLSEMDPSIVRGLQVDGKQLAVPYDFGPLVMYYNADWFSEAGVPEPRPGWTTDDFLSAARKLTGDGRYGHAVFPVPDLLAPWALSREGVQLVDDHGKLGLTDPAFAETMDWYAGLVTDEKVAPEVPSSNDPAFAMNTFMAGDAATTVDGPWQMVNVNDQVDFEVGIAPMPEGDSGSRTVVAGSGFGISSTCEEPEAAMKAISVITGPEAQQYLAEKGRAFPARTAQQPAWYSEDLRSARQGMEAALDTAVPFRTTEDWNQVSQNFVQYGIPVVNGQRDAKSFLQSVEQRAGG